MKSAKTAFRTVRLSLDDLLGTDYTRAVCEANACLTGASPRDLRALAARKVEFYPAGLQQRIAGLLPRVGGKIVKGLRRSSDGASSGAFTRATRTALAPLAGLGPFRIGEDGRLYLIAKSEHYHVSLGHGFPGFELLAHARSLGIPNATHNNTRGHITRTMERELVRTANGLAPGDEAGVRRALARKSGALNGVLNLQSGSLAVEAALKAVLGRFYRIQAELPAPPCQRFKPVILVLGDLNGGLGGNYHGTTILTQGMRGMWPELMAALAKQGALDVRAVRPNDAGDLELAFRTHHRGATRIAGLFHEFVMMNYGGLRLTPEFVRRMYALCRRHDVPVVADEIQTCLWFPTIYAFREYGVTPSLAAVGKGFSDGEYAASRLLFSASMDVMPQFGALVTNGQEEISSLAYLVSLRWAEANAEAVRCVGDYYEERLDGLCKRYPGLIAACEGRRHMGTLVFHGMAEAQQFVKHLERGGLDIGVQAYKTNAPPVAITKLPITVDHGAVDLIADRMDEALAAIRSC